MRFLVEQDEDGIFVVTCETLPGCVSQGATPQEALENCLDAAGGYLASVAMHGDAIPPRI